MIEITKPQKDYELLDSGEGEKLERFGEYILRRPDPQALWEKNLPNKKWDEADALFSRDEKRAVWERKSNVPASWSIEFGGLSLKISPTAFKHTGLFPEQLSNWQWTQKLVESFKLVGNLSHLCQDKSSDTIFEVQKSKVDKEKEINILNLFGYTGGATLASAKSGATVTHVDASKAAITWARENGKLSEMEDAPVRWMLDDALDFVKKEIKRGKKYDGIIMDPPAFGRGPNGEVWKIEGGFLELLENSKKLLSDKPLFFLVNGYASGYSPITYINNLNDLKERYGGELEAGELTIEESGSGRLLPAGIFARWRFLE